MPPFSLLKAGRGHADARNVFWQPWLMPAIEFTYNDASAERIQAVTDWDVQQSGRLVGWNPAGDLEGERADVATARS